MRFSIQWALMEMVFLFHWIIDGKWKRTHSGKLTRQKNYSPKLFFSRSAKKWIYNFTVFRPTPTAYFSYYFTHFPTVSSFSSSSQCWHNMNFHNKNSIIFLQPKLRIYAGMKRIKQSLLAMSPSPRKLGKDKIRLLIFLTLLYCKIAIC